MAAFIDVGSAARVLRASVQASLKRSAEADLLEKRKHAIFRVLGAEQLGEFTPTTRRQFDSDWERFRFDASVGQQDWNAQSAWLMLGILLKAKHGDLVFDSFVKVDEFLADLHGRFASELLAAPESWDWVIHQMIEECLVTIEPALRTATAPPDAIPTSAQRSRQRPTAEDRFFAELLPDDFPHPERMYGQASEPPDPEAEPKQTVEYFAIVDDIDEDAVLEVVAVVRHTAVSGSTSTVHSAWRREAGLWLDDHVLATALAEGSVAEFRPLSVDSGVLDGVLSQVDSSATTNRWVTPHLTDLPVAVRVGDQPTRDACRDYGCESISDDDAWTAFESRLGDYLGTMTTESDHLVINFRTNGYQPNTRGWPYVQVAGFGMAELRVEVAGSANMPAGSELLELAARRINRRGWQVDAGSGNIFAERSVSNAGDIAAELVGLARAGFALPSVSQCKVEAWGRAASAASIRRLTQLFEPCREGRSARPTNN